MGTYCDSKIVRAMRDYPCEESRMPSAHSIKKGERYLRYKLGQRWDVKVCLTCAYAERSRYDCEALQEEWERLDCPESNATERRP